MNALGKDKKGFTSYEWIKTGFQKLNGSIDLSTKRDEHHTTTNGLTSALLWGVNDLVGRPGWKNMARSPEISLDQKEK